MMLSLPDPPVIESAPSPPVIEKPSELVAWLLSVMMTPADVEDASMASTFTICASLAAFRSIEVAVRTIVSDVPAPPSTVSAPSNSLILSLASPALILSLPAPPVIVSAPRPATILSAPEPPVIASLPPPPVIEKPSDEVVWLLRVMMTPVATDEASTASTFTICSSVAAFKSADVSLRRIVSVSRPPTTVSAPTNP